VNPSPVQGKDLTVLDRREFLKTAALAAGGTAAMPLRSLAARSQTSSGFFGLHDFVEKNPQAVFIMKTKVEKKTDTEAMKNVGLTFSRSVIVPKDKGIPITTMVPIKVNLTSSSPTDKRGLEYGQGMVSDPFFNEGLIEGLKELGISPKQIFVREVNSPDHFGPRGFLAMAERTGVEMRDMGAAVGNISENDIVWQNIPKGVWYRRAPYLWPITAPNTWLIDSAKFKTHGMGVTLTMKCLQGTMVHNYQAHCTSYGSKMSVDDANLNPTANEDIKANYDRHVADKIPRWERPGAGGRSGGGIWMETWASRCLDNNSVNKAGLYLIEGVYGRDGNGFLAGPNPSPANDDNPNGEAWDFMSNIVIFGKDPAACDIIGHWMAGHEPGNFGLFHMAKERGLCRVLNPAKIPVYEWLPATGEAKLTPYTQFTRTPLKTYYLQKNYNGGTEPYYHLCNEPFTYPANEPAKVGLKDRPEATVMSQNLLNPVNPHVPIEVSLPEAGDARLEMFDSTGKLVDVLMNENLDAGNHLAVWKTAERKAGSYFYRLRFAGFTETKKLTLA
jgi:hypothetical protein